MATTGSSLCPHNAEENLWQIYSYHANDDADYAYRIQVELSDFIFSTLSGQPKMETLFKKTKKIYVMKNKVLT